MNHRLHLRFEQLERATNHLLQSAEALGNRAHQSPGAGQWSAAQVVHHLLISETGINHYIDKKLRSTEELQKAGLPHKLKSMLLRVLLRLPGIKFKAPPKLKALTPEQMPPLPELRHEWESVRRSLEQILNEYPGNLLNRAIFKHPRSGMLTIYQTLDFMLDHILHHQRQLNRIAKTLRGVTE
ncbi:DinB family protein [Hymenobacter sp. BT186]|uniref:DinB family protein n=1 Tax=Hymenobacter telluris TaxID=2816474 RepID=A0A939ERZ6_9BACT|nr:DinB family protein [Hymenobacter telluris]MBO0356699.1 DinB family protein [Hymenobacter telluris]MBW3372724.1 DinB family protein [Hymenobacter norwichensis]